MLHMLDSVLLQATNAPLSESLSGLVNAIALLVGAVVPLIVSVLSYVKAQSHDPKIEKALDTAISVGKLTTATANKALENKQSIKSAVELALSITPEEAQKSVAQKQALIDKLNGEIEATTAQLSRLKPSIPGEANADTIADLPREKTTANGRTSFPPPPPKS